MENMNQMENTSQDLTILNPEVVNQNVLAEYSITDQRIAELQDEYGSLVIVGPDDKEGIKKAEEGVKVLRKIRTTIESKRKDIKRMIVDALDGTAKRIQAQINPIEERLKNQLDEIERAAEIARQNLINERINKLIEAGFAFNGIAYQCGAVNIFAQSIESLSDDEMINNCAYARQYLAEEAARKAAEAAEQERVRRENEELRKRLAELEAQNAPKALEVAPATPVEAAPNPLAMFDRPVEPVQEPAPVMDAAPIATAFDEMIPEPSPVFDRMPMQETPTAPIPTAAIRSEFDAGYEKFREQAIALFSKPEPRFTRDQWVAFFKTITPNDIV